MFDLLKDCDYERKWSKSAPTTGDFKRQARMRLSYRCWAHLLSSPTFTQDQNKTQPLMQITLLQLLGSTQYKETNPRFYTADACRTMASFALQRLKSDLLWPADSMCPNSYERGQPGLSFEAQRGLLNRYGCSGGSHLSVTSSLFSLCSAGKMTVSVSALLQFKLSREQQATSETRSRARCPPEHAWHQTQIIHSLKDSAETFSRRGRGICSSTS